MHRSIPALLGTAAVVLPTANAWATAPTVTTKTKVVTKKVVGPAAQADSWGNVQVTLVVKRTTTTVGKKTTVKRKVTGRGYFDVRAASPETLDPSGLVKGWSVDRAAAILDEAGLSNYAINAGGDLLLRGGAWPATQWRVGIQHPLLRDQICATVEARNAAVATSGSYARGNHVLDPHTRQPPTGVLSVTVVGPELATADAYATAAFAMGRPGIHWTARLRGYEAMTILSDETILSTPGFPHADRPAG